MSTQPRCSAFAICVAVCITLLPAAVNAIGLGDRASLQATMRQHIERSLVDGSYLQLDTDTGEVHELTPVSAHPVILQMGKYFILCSDFRNDRGEDINVDFYIAPRGNSYLVFRTEIENREVVKRLMKAGKVARVN